MKNSTKSTYETVMEKISTTEKRKFRREYQELLFSEMLQALIEQDKISLKNLAKAAGVDQTTIKEFCAGTQTDLSMQHFIKILNALGCSLIAEKGKQRFSLDLGQTTGA